MLYFCSNTYLPWETIKYSDPSNGESKLSSSDFIVMFSGLLKLFTNLKHMFAVNKFELGTTFQYCKIIKSALNLMVFKPWLGFSLVSLSCEWK